MNLMKFKSFLLAGTILLFQAAGADATPITFSLLTGVVGGSPAGTGVYKADLSGLGLASIQSITIADNSSGLGGANGQFSGFDLDAIVLSKTDCPDAACAAAAAPGLNFFDFVSGVVFTPGAQRPPTDAEVVRHRPRWKYRRQRCCDAWKLRREFDDCHPRCGGVHQYG